jgi:hypothetical protein
MPTWQGFINFRCESIRSGFGWAGARGLDLRCRDAMPVVARPHRNHCLPRNFLLHGGTPLILGYTTTTTTTATPSVRYPCSSQKSFNVRADTLRWLRFRVYLTHRREYKRERLLRCSIYPGAALFDPHKANSTTQKYIRCCDNNIEPDENDSHTVSLT